MQAIPAPSAIELDCRRVSGVGWRVTMPPPKDSYGEQLDTI
jgi:hypothetical protein